MIQPNLSIDNHVTPQFQNNSVNWMLDQSGWGMGVTYAFCSIFSLYSLKKSVQVWNQATSIQNRSKKACSAVEKAGGRVLRDLIGSVGSIAYLLGWSHRAGICALGACHLIAWKVAYGCTALLSAMSIKAGIEKALKIANKIKVIQLGPAREHLERKQNAHLLLVAANTALCAWAVLIGSSAAHQAVLSALLGVGCVFWLGSFAYTFYGNGHWMELQGKVDQFLNPGASANGVKD